MAKANRKRPTTVVTKRPHDRRGAAGASGRAVGDLLCALDSKMNDSVAPQKHGVIGSSVEPDNQLNSLPKAMSAWLLPFAGKKKWSERVFSYLRAISRCGGMRRNTLAIVALNADKKVVPCNSRVCGDFFCPACSRVRGAKMLEITKQLLHVAISRGYQPWYIVLTKKSPDFSWKAGLSACTTETEREKVWRDWQFWIKWSVRLDTERKSYISDWLGTKPYGLEYAWFTEVVWRFGATSQAHIHLNYLIFFPSDLSPDAVSDFFEKLVVVNQVSMEKAVASLEKKYGTKFASYRAALGASGSFTDRQGQHIEVIDVNRPTQKLASYLIKAVFQARFGEEGDNRGLAIKSQLDPVTKAAAEVSMAMTKNDGKGLTVNQYSLDLLMQHEDPDLRDFGAATKVGWLRASKRKRMVDFSRINRKTLPKAWGCNATVKGHVQEVTSNPYAGPSEDGQDKKYLRRAGMKALKRQNFKKISETNAELYLMQQKREEAFMKGFSSGRRRILQLERYRKTGFDVKKTAWDDRLSAQCIRDIKRYRCVMSFAPGECVQLKLGSQADQKAAGKGVHAFLDAAIKAALALDNDPKIRKKRDLDARYGGRSKSLFTLVTSKMGWPPWLWETAERSVVKVMKKLEKAKVAEFLRDWQK